MSQQMSFNFEDSKNLIDTSIRVLEEKGFSHVLPLGTSKKGNGAYRSIFEDKPCTVQIDSEGYIIVKHDDSRFWDVIGGA